MLESGEAVIATVAVLQPDRNDGEFFIRLLLGDVVGGVELLVLKAGFVFAGLF